MIPARGSRSFPGSAAAREPRGSGSRRVDEEGKGSDRERASESTVVADPAGTLTPCSQLPPPPLYFPRVLPCSRTFDYAELPYLPRSSCLSSPRLVSPRLASSHLAYLATFPRNLRSPALLPRPATLPTCFSPRLFQ